MYGKTNAGAPTGAGITNSDTKVKLWENASPTSAFAAQTIALDLSEYDMVGIDFPKIGLRVASKNREVVAVWGNVWDTGANLIKRGWTATDGGVDFEGVMFRNSSAASTTATQTDNSALVPLAIYGIKGVK